ncbi:uncharacterized protein LOC128965399 [Oppia nitens]|uniref:uncharacterized protein LOC128965399 n=1 Tax=Oppia nitens TaxID=1686743 RepID=UPI0023DA6978|nr:uncharacterized protein LOC128965399 [Oppia nitens]
MKHTDIPSHKCLIIITFVTVIYLSTPVVSIKCWVCHSDADPKCADPFDNSTLPIKDCREVKYSHLTVDDEYERLTYDYEKRHGLKPDKPRPSKLLEATMCRKIRQKIHGNWRTIRGCAFLGQPGEGTGNEHNCLYRQGTHDIYQEYCTCNSKDGCNVGALGSPIFKLIVIMTIMTLIISKMI